MRAPFTPPNRPIRAAVGPISVDTLGMREYEPMWHEQEELAAARADEATGDHILLLEHPSIYTAGKRTQPEDYPPASDIPVINVDRGGRLTWHGPGQLVCYPIIKLARPVDVVDYVRRLEEAIIQTCWDFSITTAGRVDGRSGVWVPGVVDTKIAAIGIRIARDVTMHGVAINCNNTLAAYENINACGISDAGITTFTQQLGREVTPQEVADTFVPHLIDALEGKLQVANHTFATAADPTKVGTIRSHHSQEGHHHG